MKKLIASLLCACMITSAGILVGCSNEDKKDNSKETTAASEEVKDDDANSGSSEGDKPAMPEVGDSLGANLYKEFVSQIDGGKDMPSAIEAISDESISGYNCMSMDVEEGLLNGFDAEIKGFTNGKMFGPVIGSIPFVCYGFETDDTEALKSTLLSHADPRWNICTEADETFCESYSNYVFFVMLPNE